MHLSRLAPLAAFGFVLGLPYSMKVAHARDAAPPQISPAEFQRWFADAADDELKIPDGIQRRASAFRYVFVGGFRNERMPSYFVQNAKELKANEVPARKIHYIFPSSNQTIEENSEEVRDQFLAIARDGKEPLVVIAHSRGACDALAFALRNPDFVRRHVRAMFLVQGPFGGSGLADYLTGDGPKMDKRMPARHRIVARALGKREQALLSRGKHAGLADMTRSASQDFWEQLLEDEADAIPVVSPKTFYITAETRPSRLRLFQKATAAYLGTYFGPNDGAVELADQSLPDVGTVLAVLDAGHTDLSNKFPAARAKPQLRRALVQSILMAVGRAETPDR